MIYLKFKKIFKYNFFSTTVGLWPIAVSYTHLDVYKRQRQCDAKLDLYKLVLKLHCCVEGTYRVVFSLSGLHKMYCNLDILFVHSIFIVNIVFNFGFYLIKIILSLL